RPRNPGPQRLSAVPCDNLMSFKLHGNFRAPLYRCADTQVNRGAAKGQIILLRHKGMATSFDSNYCDEKNTVRTKIISQCETTIAITLPSVVCITPSDRRTRDRSRTIPGTWATNP